MQSCSCVNIPTNCGCHSFGNFGAVCANDATSQHDFRQTSTSIYRPEVDTYTYGRVNVPKRESLENKKYHAYRKIWKCNKFAKRCQQRLGGNYAEFPDDDVEISWKSWPPPIVPVPKGLKIPVQPEETVQTCAQERSYLLGEDELIAEIPDQSVPAEEITREMCLKGVLNTFESETFTVKPASVIFKNPTVGGRYTAVVKVRNKGLIPRRIGVINPLNSSIDVAWGAGIGENTLLSPGLSNTIIVTFRPQKPDAVNDTLTIIIDQDGAIVVPIIAKSTGCPVLELEEWDVGCSTLGTPRIENFKIVNKGNTGRFWILTEEEFVEEYIELHGPKPEKLSLSKIGQDENSEDSELKSVTHMREKMLKKSNNLLATPFRIFPSCFRLQRNQYMPIQIRYKPKVADYHIRKLVILCDNGEARWIAVKGIGIDPKQNPLIEVQGKWLAPPIDLPMDMSTRITLNCGDLLAGERKTECFAIKNNSCMRLYFFFATRPTRLFAGPVISSGSHDLKIQKRGCSLVEWRDYADELRDDGVITSIKLFPAQGMLEGYETIEFNVTVVAPSKAGYYSTMLSLFVQQVSEDQEHILSPILNDFKSRFSNDEPITFETLSTVLPVKEPEQMDTNSDPSSNKNDSEAPNNVDAGAGGDTAETIRNSFEFSEIPQQSTAPENALMQKITDVHFNKFAFPPSPFYFMKDAELSEENHQTQLEKLKYPESVFRRNARLYDKWEDGDSLDGRNDDEEFSYAEYFQKICHFEEHGKLSSSKEIQEETVTQDLEEQLEALKNAFENWEPEIEDMGESQLVNEVPAKEKPREDLDFEGCMLAYRVLQARIWLSNKSPLQPADELELWFMTVPLKCWFNPAVITATGSYSKKIYRTVEFTNNSPHKVNLSLETFVNEVGSIICRPFDVNVESKETFKILLTIDFRKHGDFEGKIHGNIQLPHANVPAWIPFRITASGPEACILNPIINFGLVLQGTEHVQTLVIRNNGTLRTKWTATIPSQNLEDDEFREMPLPENVTKNPSLRVWPAWGVVEPQETVGIQIYLSADCPQKIVTVCKILFEENPEEAHFITVLAEIQSTQVILRECRLTLIDAFRGLPNFSVKARLKNLTALETPFKWLQPFGTQSEFCRLQIFPDSGLLPPKGSISCRFEFISDVSLALTNVFVPCCIGGRKEVLIVKLEGTVFSLCIKIIIPKTRLFRVQREQLPWHCRDQLWPLICGIPDELPSEDHSFVQQVGIYGKYCYIKQLATQAPPPSATEEDVEQIVEMSAEDMQNAEENEDEEEEEEETEEVPANEESKKKGTKKGKRGKKDAKGKKAKDGKDETASSKKEGKQEKDTDEKGMKETKKKKAKKGKKAKEEEAPKEETPTKEIEEEMDLNQIEENPDPVETELEDHEPPPSLYKNEYLGESFTVVPEDYNPDEIMESEGRQIFFQIRQIGQIGKVIFQIFNESPLSAVYAFKVVNHPIMPQVEEYSPDFVRLDDQFWRKMTSLYTQQENLLRGKRGAAFHVYPSEGILDPYGEIDVTIEFHANADGIYEDKLECFFEGLEKPYIIKLQALAIFCEYCDGPEDPYEDEEVRPESPVEVCTRRKNPLLYKSV